MANPKEGLYQSVTKRFGDKAPLLEQPETMGERERVVHFILSCNGYYADNNNWKFSPQAMQPFLEEFKGEKVSFFGPGSQDKFFSAGDHHIDRFASVFRQDAVVETIKKFEVIDKNQAARVAFFLGGILRQATSGTTKKEVAAELVDFASRTIRFGDERSGDAVTAAISMYLISGGVTEKNPGFLKDIYHMTDALTKDKVEPIKTADLGVSQLARLRTFTGEQRPFPDIAEEQKAFNNFPTVGAEFHFSESAAAEMPRLLQRLAILNISQYQKGSFIQLSRKDKGIYEVRMNPSSYPITIANWANMGLLLPELNKAYFTTTINRQEPKTDFTWESTTDTALLHKLSAIGLLGYAQQYDDIPPFTPDEINFGTTYLGQTVRKVGTNYEYTGLWNRNKGTHGQLGIYAGYGNNFGYLAYYPAMALADPGILDGIDQTMWSGIRTLDDALSLSDVQRQAIFIEMDQKIKQNPKLQKAAVAGRNLMRHLMP